MRRVRALDAARRVVTTSALCGLLCCTPSTAEALAPLDDALRGENAARGLSRARRHPADEPGARRRLVARCQRLVKATATRRARRSQLRDGGGRPCARAAARSRGDAARAARGRARRRARRGLARRCSACAGGRKEEGRKTMIRTRPFSRSAATRRDPRPRRARRVHPDLQRPEIFALGRRLLRQQLEYVGTRASCRTRAIPRRDAGRPLVAVRHGTAASEC